MASSQRRVRFQGVLRSNDQEVTCQITATEVSIPGVPPAYCQYAVNSVSKKLPPGKYELTTRGEVIRVRFDGNFWLADVV